MGKAGRQQTLYVPRKQVAAVPMSTTCTVVSQQYLWGLKEPVVCCVEIDDMGCRLH